ncbi:MAG TPA: 3-hydroxyacyl-CoA dehydrogenase/enoyl-CoA hydratase family protein [Candidatus Tectomicrobia bacterium]
MEQRIRKVAVLGAGVMGSQIAAHLANVGMPAFLLDIVPTALTPEEQQQGLMLASPAVRNRLAQQAIQRLQRLRPAPLYTTTAAAHITPGNLQDHLHWLAEADWVIEAVTEQPEIKTQLYQAIAPHLKPGVILSSNTSGLSISTLGTALPAALQRRFLGTHFFNPPRYLKLLEIIPTPHTDPVVLETVRAFGQRVLGKGVVQAKDTPNFIANRIGIYALLCCMQVMVQEGYTIGEVDAITGPPLGRPRSATFRTADIVGLDTIWHIAQNSLAALPGDALHHIVPELQFLEAMVTRGWLGDKTGQGFYKQMRTEAGREFYEINHQTLEYQPQRPLRAPSLQQARSVTDVRQRMKLLAYANDRAGQFTWKVLSATLLYAAERLPEIANDLVTVDNAMKWGFNWELGPFETWDALDVAQAARRLQQEGRDLPPLVTALLQAGQTSFYQQDKGQRCYFDPGRGAYQEEPQAAQCLSLAVLKQQQRVVRTNPGASLIDLGEGVACLEFHTRLNAIGGDIVDMLQQAMEDVEQGFVGLVIGNEAEHFSAGANLALLLLEAQNEHWDTLDQMIRVFQNTNLALKYLSKPVVAAPAGMTLAGGCEICLAADRIQAAAETYMGLVEVGVGLIPAGGGCKELWLRHIEGLPDDVPVELFPLLQRVFQTIGQARVSTSAAEAQQTGFLRASDQITVHRDYLLYEARQTVLHLVAAGYTPPRPPRLRVVGRSGYGNLLAALYNMETARFITSYDRYIGTKLAYVLAGGDVPDGSTVTEQHVLDLEREAFLSLCGESKTQERMRHMLETGQPLRN